MDLDLLPLFEWFDTSLLADIAKSSGGVFALVQTVHLAGMAMLGGMTLLADLRLLNVLMKDVPAPVVIENTQKWINVALVAMVLSGVYMAAAVAIKLYYNEFFWSKMIAFSMGLAFLYTIKLPVLRHHYDALNPWTVRLIAVASLMTWFAVAASGRWIGFS